MSNSVPKIINTDYRPDIDGLRGLAVISVILFHFFPKFFSGGFIGVDIFFVISGYLITTIILSDILKNKFKISQFFKRRIRRIFPSLFVVIITFLLVGQLSLFNDELIKLYRHSLASSYFLTNFLLINEIGYFDQENYTKPFLHLWSLGVEEQFYIFFPFFLIIIYKLKLNPKLYIFGLILISIFLNIKISNSNSNYSFYFPLTRFWEIFTGSMISLLIHSKKLVKLKNLKFIPNIGFMGIVGCILFFNENIFKIFLIQTMPILFSCAIIISNNDSFVKKWILTNNGLVYIGLISYPLYLWHWPLLSFAKIFFINLNFGISLTLILLSFILSHLTYKFIELKIKKINSYEIFYLLLLPLIVSIIVLSFKTYLKDREIDDHVLEKNSQPQWSYPKQLKGCLKNNRFLENKLFVCLHDPRGINKYMLIGDSKAVSLHKGLIETIQNNKSWIIIAGSNGEFGYGSPSPFLSENLVYQNNQNLLKAALNSIDKNDNLETIVLIPTLRVMASGEVTDKSWSNADKADYSLGASALERTVKEIITKNKKILLITDNPPLQNYYLCNDRLINIPLLDFSFKVKIKHEECSMTMSEYNKKRERYMEKLQNIENKYKDNVMIFDISRYIFNDEKNAFTRVLNGYSLYQYTDHISEELSLTLGLEINKVLNKY